MKKASRFKRRYPYLVITGILAALTVFTCLAACVEPTIKVGYAGSNIGNKINASYQLFTGTETKTIPGEVGKSIVIEYSSVVEKGELKMLIYDPDMNFVADLEANTTGTREIVFERDGNYKLEITGENTKGSFDVRWESG